MDRIILTVIDSNFLLLESGGGHQQKLKRIGGCSSMQSIAGMDDMKSYLPQEHYLELDANGLSQKLNSLISFSVMLTRRLAVTPKC